MLNYLSIFFNWRTYNPRKKSLLLPVVRIAENWTNTVFVLSRASCVEFVWKMRIRATSVPRVYFQTTKETTNTASDNMADCAFHGITTRRRQIVWRYIRLPAIALSWSLFSKTLREYYPPRALFEKTHILSCQSASKSGLIDTWLYISLMSELVLPFWSALTDKCEVCHPRDRSKRIDRSKFNARLSVAIHGHLFVQIKSASLLLKFEYGGANGILSGSLMEKDSSLARWSTPWAPFVWRSDFSLHYATLWPPKTKKGKTPEVHSHVK